ncbi:unnamed protein product [Haemonchus placei]|uniref:PLAT domain-containing protein n=1 Tax=Haemonchus placei TaxID=6290 RepID=A0A0N4W9I9_HAEPC|nr:unnamed protein product [Haemonchus placei]
MSKVFRDSALVVKKKTPSVLLLIIKKKWVLGNLRCNDIPPIGEVIMIDWRNTGGPDTIDICSWNSYSDTMGGFVVSESAETGTKFTGMFYTMGRIIYSGVALENPAVFNNVIGVVQDTANVLNKDYIGKLRATVSFDEHCDGCHWAIISVDEYLKKGDSEPNVIPIEIEWKRDIDQRERDPKLLYSLLGREVSFAASKDPRNREWSCVTGTVEPTKADNFNISREGDFFKIEIAVEYIGCTDEHGCILVWSDLVEFVVDKNRLFKDREYGIYHVYAARHYHKLQFAKWNVKYVGRLIKPIGGHISRFEDKGCSESHAAASGKYSKEVKSSAKENVEAENVLNKAMPKVFRDSALVVKKETLTVLLLIIKKKWVLGNFRCSFIPSVGEVIMIDWRSTESRDTIDIRSWKIYSEVMGGFVVSETTEAGAKETRWKGSKVREIGEGVKLFYNGEDIKRNGVAIAVADSLKDSVSAVNRNSGRIMAIIQGQFWRLIHLTPAHLTGMFYTMGRITYGGVALENPAVFNNVIGVVQDTANVLNRNYIGKIKATVSFDEDYDGCHWTLISVDEYLKKGVSESFDWTDGPELRYLMGFWKFLRKLAAKAALHSGYSDDDYSSLQGKTVTAVAVPTHDPKLPYSLLGRKVNFAAYKDPRNQKWSCVVGTIKPTETNNFSISREGDFFKIELAVEYIGCTDEHGSILVWSDQLEFVVDTNRLFKDREYGIYRVHVARHNLQLQFAKWNVKYVGELIKPVGGHISRSEVSSKND